MMKMSDELFRKLIKEAYIEGCRDTQTKFVDLGEFGSSNESWDLSNSKKDLDLYHEN